MAKKGSPSTQKAQYQRNGFAKLPFHSPSFTRAEKATMVEKLNAGDVGLVHLNEVLSQNDWLKLRYDNDNGVWLVIHSYTAPGSDEPMGLVTYRAKKLENALCMAIWGADNLDTSLFEPEEEDDF